MGSLVPLPGRDLSFSSGGASVVPGWSDEELSFSPPWQAKIPIAPAQGHCAPSRTQVLVGPRCSSPLLGKGCLHITCHGHHWGLNAVPKAFPCQASSPTPPLAGICGVPVQSLEPPENPGRPAHQGPCTFSSAQDIQATRVIIAH